MGCLYESDTNKKKCNCLKEKNCHNCSFYKENTKENYQKYIVQAEKDIKNYRRNLS